MPNGRSGKRARARNRSLRRERDTDAAGPTGIVGSFATLSSGVGFPRKLHSRHRYITEFTLTATTGTFADYIFCANGMYDPDLTSTGHQPLYFDQMATIYDHFTVFRSHIKLEVLPDAKCYVVLLPYDGGSLPGTQSEAAEQVGARSALVTNLVTRPQVLQVGWSAKDYFGGDIFDNDNLQGNGSANPTEQSRFLIRLTGAGGAGASAFCRATIDYEAVWDELKVATTS
jgi:hypothetical protein